MRSAENFPFRGKFSEVYIHLYNEMQKRLHEWEEENIPFIEIDILTLTGFTDLVHNQGKFSLVSI